MGARLIPALLGFVLIAFAQGAQAADPALCRNCHNPQGVIAPDLSGMATDTFLAAVQAFRAGQRTHPVMVSFARSLSDADVAKLAAHFSALGPDGTRHVAVKPAKPGK